MFKASQNYPFRPINSVLQQYNQEWLYLKYTGIYPEIGKYYSSLFRRDSTPGCRFEWQSGVLYFIDNATYNGKTRFDIIGVICELYRVSITKAIHLIETENIPSYSIDFQNNKTTVKIKPEIRFKYKEWDQNNYFGIKPTYLQDENVYLVTDYWIKNGSTWQHNHIHNPKQSLTIAYYFPDTNNVKLYWPNERDFRWYSNCSNEIFGEDRLLYYLESDPRLLVITKSQKDRLVFKYYHGINAIAPQSETTNLPEHIIRTCKKFNNVLIIYDNDVTGQQYASQISENTGFDWINFPMYKDAFDNRYHNNFFDYVKDNYNKR